MQGKIFISYRRSDSLWPARALFERLWRSFPERIFIDLEGIELGVDFSRAIDAHLEGCHAMLAVIGPGWLAQIKERLQHEEDQTTCASNWRARCSATFRWCRCWWTARPCRAPSSCRKT